jgi:hypothetical protein
MPFGRYKGRELRCVPEGYLFWCRDSLALEPELENAIRQELFERSTRRLVELLRESPGTAGRLKENIADLIRTAERAGYPCPALNELLQPKE